MLILFTTLHVVVSLFLIIVVLLQSGKAADLAGAFGGMGSQTAFGPRGAATILSKATTTAAVLFMLTSITLGIWQGRNIGAGQSVIERSGVGAEESETVPAPVPADQLENITPNIEITPMSAEDAAAATDSGAENE